MRSPILVALLVAAAWPLPGAHAQEGAEPPLTDAEGDARWFTSSDVEAQAREACDIAGEPTRRACANVPGGAPEVGGAPAPASLDLVSGDVRVVDGHVVAEMGIATLTDPLTPLGVGDESVFYMLDWASGSDTAAGFGVGVYHIDGTTQLDWWFFRMDAQCARVNNCFFEPEGEIIPGTPGTIRWRLPHFALPPDTPSEVELLGRVTHRSYGVASAGRSYEHSVELRDQRVSGSTPHTLEDTTDVAGPGRATPLGPPPSWDPQRDRIGAREDQTGDAPDGRADLDVLAMRLEETERTFTVSAQLARVDEVPQDHAFTIDLLLTTGASLTAGYVASGGARTTFHGVCDPECGPTPATPLPHPAEVEVVAGEPGYVNVTFARRTLGSPGHGDTFNQLFVAALLPQAVDQREAPVGEARARRYDHMLGDAMWDAPPWWFVLGGSRLPPRASEVVVVEDPAGDVSTAITLAALSADLAPFDIVSLRGSPGAEPGLFRVELGIRDLSGVEPPQGYAAVFYGVGFATEQGPIMAGYYDEPASAKRQFFCAPDTAIVTQPPDDPQKVIWQPIEGLLSIVRDRGQGVAGGSTPGSIIFLVPSSCFGLEPGADLHAEVFAASTYLFSSAGEMELVDAAQSDSPVVIRAAQAARPAWWVEPFGIPEFWNIASIAGAVLVSAIGLLLALKKRGALRRYLHEIERVLRENAADARSREKALLAIQLRVRDDLLKGRITESHFVIVERRLDLELSTVRVQALGDAFGDLPHRLLLTLKDLLRDGVMDREDWQLFRTQLAGEEHLTPQARAAIERRVEVWVREESNLHPVAR